MMADQVEERVTLAPEVPSEAVTLRSKDPKKVVAGRAGAAARKAKQERVLEELRAAKASLKHSDTSHAATNRHDEPTPKPAQRHDTSPWTSLIIGGAGLAAIGYMLNMRANRHKTRSVVTQSAEKVASADAQQQLPDTPQLKVSTDPFYMQ